MNVHRAIRVGLIVGALTIVASLSAEQPPEPAAVPLTVAAGRSIEVVIDERITIKSVGQPVAGNLVEPLYAFDREVVPSGTRVLWHVAALDDPSKAGPSHPQPIHTCVHPDRSGPRRFVPYDPSDGERAGSVYRQDSRRISSGPRGATEVAISFS